MKLIVVGGTGYTATEVIRQSLRLPQITSVIALARRSVTPPDGLEPDADASKLKSVVLNDLGSYSEEDKKQIAGADACICDHTAGAYGAVLLTQPHKFGEIRAGNNHDEVANEFETRTLAITPRKSSSMAWENVRRICYDYTLTGLQAIFETRNKHSSAPLRFLYMSGSSSERDRSKTPRFMPEYIWMRGEVELQVIAFGKEHKGEVEVNVVLPGLINEAGNDVESVSMNMGGTDVVLPAISITNVSAAMLDQVVNGFEKETLENDDLIRIGKAALKN